MVKNLRRKVGSIYAQYSRVLRLLKKPTMQEFKTISKVSSIGLLLIGLIGFLISLIMVELF